MKEGKKVLLVIGGPVLTNMMDGLLKLGYAVERVSTKKAVISRLIREGDCYSAIVITEEIKGTSRHEFACIARNALAHQKERAAIICLGSEVNQNSLGDIKRVRGAVYTVIPNAFDVLQQTLAEELAALAVNSLFRNY